MSTGCIRKAEKAHEIPPANADLTRWPISNPAPDLIKGGGGDLDVNFPIFAKFKLHDVSDEFVSIEQSRPVCGYKYWVFTNKWFRIETTWDSSFLFFAFLDLLGSTDTLCTNLNSSSSSLKSSIVPKHVKRVDRRWNIVRIDLQHVGESFELSISTKVLFVKSASCPLG